MQSSSPGIASPLRGLGKQIRDAEVMVVMDGGDAIGRGGIVHQPIV